MNQLRCFKQNIEQKMEKKKSESKAEVRFFNDVSNLKFYHTTNALFASTKIHIKMISPKYSIAITIFNEIIVNWTID